MKTTTWIWKRALCLALLGLTLGACGGEDSDAGDDNNGANNGQNNGTNNGTNNGANNGANNGTNNGANNGQNNGGPDLGNNGEPDVVEPDVVEPDVVEPDVVEPDVVEPDVVEPDMSDPDVVEPDMEESPCDMGERLCGDRCVDLDSDGAHCGACDNVCGEGELCQGGACAGCGPDQLLCDGACVPFVSDAHCGACDSACGDNQYCYGDEPGEAFCRCSPGFERCAGNDCVPLDSDAHCGACNNACGGGSSCVEGACACPEGQALCDGTCIPLNTQENCGACGESCPEAQACIDGACACPESDLTLCDDQCRPLATDPLHCGACGNACGEGQSCVAGACACPEGQDLCDGICIPLNTQENCGACGDACGEDERCEGGQCVCASSCDGLCVDLQIDATHCGACGNACGDGEVCVEGQCRQTGCADGEREGFVDLERFRRIAACAGGFGLAGVGPGAPACARGAGDDGDNPNGAGCNAQDLCAPGWQVCPSAQYVRASLPEGSGCGELGATIGGAYMFATGQRGSNTVGLSCDGMGTNDVFGCGAPTVNVNQNCAPFNRLIGGANPLAPWVLGPRAAANTTEWMTVTKPGPGGGGVLCCPVFD
jgi:hypothetical protein